MRRILAAVAGVVLALGPAWAQDEGKEQPSQEQSLVVRAVAASAFADKHCPHVRINEGNELKILGAINLKPADLYLRFREYSVKFTLLIDNEYQQHPEEFCEFLIQTYGPGGKIPGLLDKF